MERMRVTDITTLYGGEVFTLTSTDGETKIEASAYDLRNMGVEQYSTLTVGAMVMLNLAENSV